MAGRKKLKEKRKAERIELERKERKKENKAK